MSRKGQAWTEEEIEIVKKYYPIGGSQAVKEHLKKRSIMAIRGKAAALNIFFKKGPTWTEEEVEILRKYYPIGGVGAVKEYLKDRSENAIFTKATKLHVPEHKKRHEYKKRYNKKWTEEEIDILREFYPIEGEKVTERLPGRTQDQCTAMAKHKGIRKNGASSIPFLSR